MPAHGVCSHVLPDRYRSQWQAGMLRSGGSKRIVHFVLRESCRGRRVWHFLRNCQVHSPVHLRSHSYRIAWQLISGDMRTVVIDDSTRNTPHARQTISILMVCAWSLLNISRGRTFTGTEPIVVTRQSPRPACAGHRPSSFDRPTSSCNGKPH